jgi:hypothetical protein
MVNKLITSAGLKLAYSYLNSNPEENIPKLMDLADRFAGETLMKDQRDAMRKVIEDKDINWNKLLFSLWSDVDAGVRRALFNNFIINANFIGWPIQEANRAKYGCNIPWAILMDPTAACNLRCVGCWAAEYGHHASMSRARSWASTSTCSPAVSRSSGKRTSSRCAKSTTTACSRPSPTAR